MQRQHGRRSSAAARCAGGQPCVGAGPRRAARPAKLVQALHACEPRRQGELCVAPNRAALRVQTSHQAQHCFQGCSPQQDDATLQAGPLGAPLSHPGAPVLPCGCQQAVGQTSSTPASCLPLHHQLAPSAEAAADLPVHHLCKAPLHLVPPIASVPCGGAPGSQVHPEHSAGGLCCQGGTTPSQQGLAPGLLPPIPQDCAPACEHGQDTLYLLHTHRWHANRVATVPASSSSSRTCTAAGVALLPLPAWRLPAPPGHAMLRAVCLPCAPASGPQLPGT